MEQNGYFTCRQPCIYCMKKNWGKEHHHTRTQSFLFFFVLVISLIKTECWPKEKNGKPFSSTKWSHLQKFSNLGVLLKRLFCTEPINQSMTIWLKSFQFVSCRNSEVNQTLQKDGSSSLQRWQMQTLFDETSGGGDTSKGSKSEGKELET